MNGLKYIRNRCNLSLNELAEAIGVTRQALSSWETEKKPIPAQRKKQLSIYFGIDEDYFGEISEDKKKDLLEKAMFRYVDNGKESYRYKPHNKDSLQGECICFPGDSTDTLDEKFVAAQKRKQTTLEKADEIIRYYDKGGDITSQITNYNRGCNIYDSINILMDGMQQQSIINRMMYYQEIYSVIEALLLAHGYKNKQEIEEEYLPMKNTSYDETRYIFSLANIITEHWILKENEIEQIDSDFQKHKAEDSLSSASITQTPSPDEQIAHAEEENRKFWESHPEMKIQDGMRFLGQ